VSDARSKPLPSASRVKGVGLAKGLDKHEEINGPLVQISSLSGLASEKIYTAAVTGNVPMVSDEYALYCNINDHDRLEKSTRGIKREYEDNGDLLEHQIDFHYHDQCEGPNKRLKHENEDKHNFPELQSIVSNGVRYKRENVAIKLEYHDPRGLMELEASNRFWARRLGKTKLSADDVLINEVLALEPRRTRSGKILGAP